VYTEFRFSVLTCREYYNESLSVQGILRNHVSLVPTTAFFYEGAIVLTKEYLDELYTGAEERIVDIETVIHDKDKYSRDKVDQLAVLEYSEKLAILPPIVINQDGVIVDGVHRYLASKKAEQKQIRVKQIEIDGDNIQLANLLFDITSGVRHPEVDIKKICQHYWSADPEANKALYTELGISQQRFSEYTSDIAKARKAEVNKQIAYALLDPTKTQDEIAEMFSIGKNVISKLKTEIITSLPESGISVKDALLEANLDFLSDRYDWQPALYNIWNKAKGDESNNHFGHFPLHFMKNLLYYHTQPFDTVYDPFAGGGTTIDACEFMMRKYIVTDRKPMEHRDEIQRHDINDGLPEYLPSKIHLAFLDPPYWKQAENKYSTDAEDLGNMDIDMFNDSMQRLFSELTKKKVDRIALVIQPTQYKNGWKWKDHIFDFNTMLSKYEIEMRYILPYSTQQYNAQMVEKAKETKHCLCLNRDLIIWKLI